MRIERLRPFGGVERWEPFHGMTEIQGEMNKLFDRFFGRPLTLEAEPRARWWMPAVDMYETKDDVVLAFELPGVPEKNIALSITGDLLTIGGERPLGHDVEEGSSYQIERAHGKFERAIKLPVPVQADKVKATYRDGVLEVRLPKAEEIKPRAIKIDIL